MSQPLFFIGRGTPDVGTVSVLTGTGYRTREEAEAAIARVVEPRDPTYCIVQMGEIVKDFYKPKPRPQLDDE